MQELDKKIKINLSKSLMSVLNSGDWEELFTMTDCDDCPLNNDGFYRDVHWQNDGLKKKCIQVVDYILEDSPENIIHIWKMSGVQSSLKRTDSDTYDYIEAIINNDAGKSVAKPVLVNSNVSIYDALDDAEVLIDQRGAAHGYDRMHTALHSFLRQACDNHNISYEKVDAINALLPKINNHIKALPDDGRNDKVFKMLRSANAMLDSINYLRNHNSLSHPTEELLTESDAHFSINLVRSIMTYVDDLLD